MTCIYDPYDECLGGCKDCPREFINQEEDE